MRCFRRPGGGPRPYEKTRGREHMSRISIGARTRLRRTLAGGASAAVLVLWAGPALAQDEPDDETATEQNGEPTITVTGSRLFVTGMDTPVPVTAVPAEELEAMDPSSLIASV